MGRRWIGNLSRAAVMLILAMIIGCSGAAVDESESGDTSEAAELRLEAVASEAEAADLVIAGGRIVTVSDQLPEAEALAAKDGRIVAIGSLEEVALLVGAATEVIDLQGHLAIPGFVEAHAHFLSLGDSQLQLDLREAATWEEIVAQVEEAISSLEPGQWIRGRGWHQEKWTSLPSPELEGFPIHDSLSAISPENPVILTHASGHAAFVNAKALELAGIDASTDDPAGGDILRDAEGRATGLLREEAASLVHRVRPERDERDLRRAIELASQESLSKGITSFHDAGVSFSDLDLLKEAVDTGKLGIRLWVMILGSEENLDARLPEVRTDDYKDQLLAVGGIKQWLDGALGSRGAWLLEPYEDAPDSTGLAVTPIEEIRRVAELALKHDYQMGVHAIGDRANREILDLYEEIFAAHPEKEDLRWRIEHAQHLALEDIPRFAELGVVAAMQGVHCTSDGPWVPDRIGEKRASDGAYVWRKLLDSGARVANGTDAPVEDVNPIASYYSTVSRRLPDGSQFFPNQRMTRMEALRSYTLDAAWAARQESLLGSLEVGKMADLTILSRDILEVEEDAIPETEVLYTVLGGRVAYRKP